MNWLFLLTLDAALGTIGLTAWRASRSGQVEVRPSALAIFFGALAMLTLIEGTVFLLKTPT
jgi:hypothetical protein